MVCPGGTDRNGPVWIVVFGWLGWGRIGMVSPPGTAWYGKSYRDGAEWSGMDSRFWLVWPGLVWPVI